MAEINLYSYNNPITMSIFVDVLDEICGSSDVFGVLTKILDWSYLVVCNKIQLDDMLPIIEISNTVFDKLFWCNLSIKYARKMTRKFMIKYQDELTWHIIGNKREIKYSLYRKLNNHNRRLCITPMMIYGNMSITNILKVAKHNARLIQWRQLFKARNMTSKEIDDVINFYIVGSSKIRSVMDMCLLPTYQLLTLKQLLLLRKYVALSVEVLSGYPDSIASTVFKKYDKKNIPYYMSRRSGITNDINILDSDRTHVLPSSHIHNYEEIKEVTISDDIIMRRFWNDLHQHTGDDAGDDAGAGAGAGADTNDNVVNSIDQQYKDMIKN